MAALTSSKSKTVAEDVASSPADECALLPWSTSGSTSTAVTPVSNVTSVSSVSVGSLADCLSLVSF
jgi:hypothetical protein